MMILNEIVAEFINSSKMFHFFHIFNFFFKFLFFFSSSSIFFLYFFNWFSLSKSSTVKGWEIDKDTILIRRLRRVTSTALLISIWAFMLKIFDDFLYISLVKIVKVFNKPCRQRLFSFVFVCGNLSRFTVYNSRWKSLSSKDSRAMKLLVFDEYKRVDFDDRMNHIEWSAYWVGGINAFLTLWRASWSKLVELKKIRREEGRSNSFENHDEY